MQTYSNHTKAIKLQNQTNNKARSQYKSIPNQTKHANKSKHPASAKS